MFADLIMIVIFWFCNHLFSECARVEFMESLVQGNLSDSQTLRFNYSLDSKDEPTSIILKCGYYATPSNFQVVVSKAGVAGQLISQLSRFEPYVDPNNPSVLGFTIRDIRREDARDYICTLDYRPSGRFIEQAASPPVRFEVLIKPAWLNDDCLRVFDPVIREGEDLRIYCVVTGFPPPFLECTLHKFNGELVDGFNRIGPEIANFTTRSFGRIPRDLRRIMCQAYTSNASTGVLTKVVDMPAQFEYSPFAVRYCEVYSRTNRTIEIRWLPILSNETSPDLMYYAIEYYIIRDTATLMRERVSVFTPNYPTRDNVYIYYTLDSPASGYMHVASIFGVNAFREGAICRPHETVVVSQSPTTPSSVDVVLTGEIVGVSGAVVLSLVVVFLVI